MERGLERLRRRLGAMEMAVAGALAMGLIATDACSRSGGLAPGPADQVIKLCHIPPSRSTKLRFSSPVTKSAHRSVFRMRRVGLTR